MSNLDNLIQKILDDAKERASIIMEDSIKVKEEIIDSKLREANENKKKIVERATGEASLLKDRVISSAELKVRNEKLKAKQSVIERVFNLSKESLRNLDEAQYISFLTNTLKGLNLSGEETLIVPERMRDKVKSLGLFPKVSEEETVDSGFLIKDKGIILNYTFDSLVEHYREELETEIAQSLFKE